MALTMQQERAKRAHKGQDCVSIRVDGEHVMYACQTHLFIALGDIEQGDDTMWVDTWTVPAYLINANHKIVCEYDKE